MTFTMEEVKEFPRPKERRSKSIGRGLAVAAVTVVAVVIAAVLAGLIVSLSANASITGLQIVFDPQITLGYLAVAWLVGYFHQLTKSQQYQLFLFGLLLSFTLNFIQGVLTLVLLVPVLKRLRLI